MIELVGNFRKIAEKIAAVILASMFITFLLQIFFRYVVGWSVGWTIEYVSIAWLWIIMFGYAFVIKETEVIKSNMTCGAILLYSLPKSIDYIDFMSIERTAYLRLNFALLFSIYVPFALIVSIRCFFNSWKAFEGTSYQNKSNSSIATESS
jgi:C4-dicarboxylate transporter DctQ subunit